MIHAAQQVEQDAPAIAFRLATPADAALLFIWRNDALTCAMSRNPVPVKWEDHLAWLASRLGRRQPDLFIAEYAGQPIGTLRIDGEEISYTICPTVRARGLGTAMLVEARRHFGRLTAEIFSRNIASIRAAERAGMNVVIIDRDQALIAP